MPNDDTIKLRGSVEEVLPSAKFRIKLETGQIVIGHLAGKLRMNRIRIIVGDEVQVEFSPYDLTKGRVIYRY